MKILVLSPIFPYPLNSGAAIRLFNLLKYLSEKNDLQLISIADRQINENDISELRKYCSRVCLVKLKKNIKILQLPKIIKRFLSGQPFMLKYAESKGLEKLLYEVTKNEHFDVIHFEHSYMANNIQFLHQSLKAKKVLSFHNIASFQYYRVFKSEHNIIKKIKYLLEWLPMFEWEPKAASLFDKSIVVSTMEKALLTFLNPGIDISVVPNGVDSKLFTSTSINNKEKNILMVGSLDYSPNADAVKFFYHKIFPIVIKSIPEAKLVVVGRNPPRDVRMISRDTHVIVRGNVEDVRSYYEKARISVVPLRSGGGTRLKIVESMAMGIPVISTSIGCEGLDVHNNQNILIANEPKEFANAIINLFSSQDLWNRLSHEGRILVEEKYDWEKITLSLQNIYQELVTT